MFKKFSTIMAAVVLALSLTGNAFAAFENLKLVRVVLNQTGGTTEIATDLGALVSTGGTVTSGTYGGGASAFTAQTGGINFSNLHVAYFAINRVGSTGKELWITGVDPVGEIGKSSTVASLTTAIFNYYNTLPVTGTTIAAAADNSNSYRVRADQTSNFGAFGTFITATTQAGTEAPLTTLTTTPVIQDLYYFANYGVGAAGVKVATITTNSDGSTTIGPPPATGPTVSSLSPNSQSQGTGPTTVTITGTGFATGATVTFSGTGVSAEPATVVDATTITVPVTVTAGATVGARDVTVTNPDTSSGTKTNGFTVNAALLEPTITWPTPAAITYGTALSGTQLNATASVPGTFSYSPGEGSVFPVGIHELSVTFTPDDSASYTTANKTVNLTVTTATQATLTVTGVPVTAQTYNATFAVASAGGSGSGAVTFAASGACSNAGTLVTMTSGSGTCSVMATKAADTNYSAATSAAATVDAAKAVLTITAGSTSRSYGAANPAVTTFTSAGLVGTDTITSVTNTIAASATATAAAGSSHPVTPSTPVFGSGAVSNYSVTYVNGALTIIKAPLTVTADSQSKTYGAANPSLTVSYNGFVNGDTASSLTTQPTASTAAITGSPVGSYPINASGGVSSNYSFTYVAGTLTVNKASQIITFGVIAPKVLGAPDFALGATASSGLAVTYTSSNTAVATIVDGKVHLVAAGSTTITANQSGDGNFNNATDVPRTLDVVATTGNTFVSGNPYSSFGAAYIAANLPTSDGVIYARDISFGEILNLTDNKAIKIRGGYDINYLNQTGYSQLKSLTVKKGSVVVERLIIR